MCPFSYSATRIRTWKCWNQNPVPYHLAIALYELILKESNVGKRIRTPDLLVRSQTLYPAELNAHFFVALELFVYHSFPLTSCILHYPKRKVNTFLKKI